MFFDETYFFSETIPEGLFVLSEEESLHASAVLRIKKGDRILVTDGKGMLAECEIEKSDPRTTSLCAVKRHGVPAEIPEITLAAGILKKNSFEALVELVSQLPVARIVPVDTARAALPVHAYASFLPRLNQKARTALKQSKRAFVTRVEAPIPFAKALQQAATAGYACLFEKGAASAGPSDVARLSSAVSLFVLTGPEGGFTEDETRAARDAGLSILELGSTRLRAEAAGFAAAVALLTRREKTA
ncbi:MAG: RsmE family RNA methyltransferase [Fibrobacterota bacterium]